MAFWTSLQKDEGRPLTFVIDYKIGDDHVVVKALKERLPLTTENLARIAPVCAFDKWAIAICPDSDHKLEISGLISTGDMFRTKLRIKIIDPGVLLVSLFTANIAVISPSQTALLESPFLSQYGGLWNLLRPEDDNERHLKFQIKIRAVQSMIRQLYYRGHGGLLIIVPDETWINDVVYPPRFLCEGFKVPEDFFLELVVKAYAKADTDYAFRLENNLYDSAKRTADLASIDGAVLIDRHLSVVAFGVKIKTSSPKGEPTTIGVLEPAEPMTKITYLPSLELLGNMRHQSASWFIFNQPSALAFVVSQDKGVTGIVGQVLEDGSTGILAHRHLELSLF